MTAFSVFACWEVWTAVFLYLQNVDFHDYTCCNEDLGEELRGNLDL
jgi:hypothetical protein